MPQPVVDTSDHIYDMRPILGGPYAVVISRICTTQVTVVKLKNDGPGRRSVIHQRSGRRLGRITYERGINQRREVDRLFTRLIAEYGANELQLILAALPTAIGAALTVIQGEVL